MDIFDIFLKLLLVIFLVLLNGFFVAAEFALVKVRDTQLETLIIKGHRRAKIARRIINNLDAALSATQLGITLASLALGAVGEPVVGRMIEPLLTWMHVPKEFSHSISFAVALAIITFLHVVAGEVAPKSLAIQKPVPTAIWVAQPLEWFYKITFPAIWALNHAAAWLLRRFGIEPVSESELVHSEEELRMLISSTQRHMGASKVGRDIVLNALDLRRRIVRDVMRPRQQIVAFDVEMSTTECMDIGEKTRYSRFPLIEDGDLDKTLGVIHIKDLYAMRIKAKSARELMPVLRKIVYVPETARLEKVLQLLLERRLHFAIVVDEYGGTVGMLTLENILEELVGQIQDEFDQEKPLLVKTSENTWEVDGLLPLHELSDLSGQELSSEGVSTVSGWVTHQLRGFAKRGDVVALGAFELRVEDMEGLRVSRLKLLRKETPAAGDHDTDMHRQPPD
jgi:CBS domain containing-hemolysin-like protein